MTLKPGLRVVVAETHEARHWRGFVGTVVEAPSLLEAGMVTVWLDRWFAMEFKPGDLVLKES